VRVAIAFFALHVLALGLGLFGLLSAVPNPAQFIGNPPALAVYGWALQNTGTVDILTGAAAMLAFGAAWLGWRRTLLFAICATVISATAELTGTKTGWPFGGYAYTGFLGWELGGRVPYSIPLSWFYMGFASYLLAARIVQPARLRNELAAAILLGAWLLTAWDLVLDPAMASERLTTLHFWIWHEHGAYFGMPLRNLAGWFGTGLLFIAAGRLSWRTPFEPRTPAIWLPYGVYAINVLWAMALSLSVGLWQTALAAVVFSLLPASLALRRPSPAGTKEPQAQAA
jgi:putative membrane protein